METTTAAAESVPSTQTVLTVRSSDGVVVKLPGSVWRSFRFLEEFDDIQCGTTTAFAESSGGLELDGMSSRTAACYVGWLGGGASQQLSAYNVQELFDMLFAADRYDLAPQLVTQLSNAARVAADKCSDEELARAIGGDGGGGEFTDDEKAQIAIEKMWFDIVTAAPARAAAAAAAATVAPADDDDDDELDY